MRQITESEILAFNKFLRMEVNSLAMARASTNLITDEQLKNMAQSGIAQAETRIQGLQQFISENNITTQEVQ